MESVTFVIFGGTGDLAKARLVPAISSLVRRGEVGKNSAVIGIGRRDLDDKSYAEFVGTDLKARYLKADVENDENIAPLLRMIKQLGNKEVVLYLSISYKYFGKITKQLKRYKLNGQNFKIIFEKPFGHDLKSSLLLHKEIYSVFKHEQVFRIDHYLGKETVQNLLVLRFANPLLEKVWNKDFIDRILLINDEESGVGTRSAYYDGAGAVKDMVQNHMLQLASFILMDSPKTLDSDHVHDQKAKAIRDLYIKSGKDIVLGQYDGYKQDVGKESKTETYAAMKLFSKSKRWTNVPIVIKTGKMLAKKEAYIIIEFKKEPCILYCSPFTPPNRLIIKIQPVQEIVLELSMKKHDSFDVEPITLNFCHDCKFQGNAPETYRKLMLEAISGSKMLFPRFDEITASWKVIDKVARLAKNASLNIYEKGKGPKNF